MLAEKFEALQPEVAEVAAAAEVFAVPPPEGEDDQDGATSTSSSALSDSQPGHKERKPKSKKGKKGPPSSPSAGRRRQSDERRSPKGAEQKDGASSPRAGAKKQRSPAPSSSHLPVSPSAAFDDRSSPEASSIALASSIPSGPYLHHQLQKMQSLNDETKRLLDNWQTRATGGLEDALKFEEDYDGLYHWVEEKKAEADELGPVGVTKEKILEQIAAVEVRDRTASG